MILIIAIILILVISLEKEHFLILLFLFKKVSGFSGEWKQRTIESGSYIARAELTGDTYFSLGTQWNDITQAYGLSDKEMFNLFNTRALDDAVMQGKTIRFSQNPLDWSGTALGDEWSYLQHNHGYRDLIEMGGYWYAIK